MPIVALVDCNNFYVSCERSTRPDLKYKAVVVLSNNDGCVIARSNEAKEMGIKNGTLAFEMKKLFDNGSVVPFSSNYSLYHSLSTRVHNIIRMFAPDLEVYSIDEVFLDLTSFKHYDLTKLAEDIRTAVKKWTGIPVSIGIAKTKTLAKLANRRAKKLPSGILTLTDPNDITEVLGEAKTSDIWGIGGAYQAKLAAEGVYTALQLRNMPEAWVRKQMTVVGLRLVLELKGISCIKLEEVQPAKKGIMSCKSFGSDALTYDEVSTALATHTITAAGKLRDQGCSAGVISVFVNSNSYRKNLPQYNKSLSVTLQQATSSNLDLVKVALWALRKIYKDGFHYKKCGIMIVGIVPDCEIQQSFFHKVSPMKSKTVSRVMDELNTRYGSKSVRLAVMGTEDVFWKPVQNHLSPKHTTQWGQLIRIQA